MADSTVVTDQFTALEEKLTTFTKAVTTRVPIAQTPKELIWALNKAKLYRYVPVVPKERRHPVPLLLVFALMNRPYILDLRPGHSFVEFMVKSGYDLYLLDWGVPGIEDKDLKFDDYAMDYLPRAIRKLKAVAGVEEFSMLGWCIGAILATVYAALKADNGLRNLILLTAPLDFSDKQHLTFARWVDERYFDVDKVVAAFGNMPGEMIDYGAKALFGLLRPTRLNCPSGAFATLLRGELDRSGRTAFFPAFASESNGGWILLFQVHDFNST